MNGMKTESVGGLLKEGDLYPCYDANGNITQKLDNSGNVVMNVSYDPFGNIISGTLTGEYGFSTKPLVDGVDWYYYGFRYYDPVTGRWPSRDPIGEVGGLNPYGFGPNNPVNGYDVLGQHWSSPNFGSGPMGPAGGPMGDLNLSFQFPAYGFGGGCTPSSITINFTYDGCGVCLSGVKITLFNCTFYFGVVSASFSYETSEDVSCN